MNVAENISPKSKKVRGVWSYLLTCLVVSLVVAPVLDKNVFQDVDRFLITVFFGLFYSFSGLYGSVWLFRYLDRKYDWIKDLWKRMLLGLFVVVAWSLVIYVLITPILLFFFRRDGLDNIGRELMSNLLYPPLLGVSGMVVIASVEFFKNWKNSLIKKENLKAEMMTYKYEALHNQLNPHFLFNSFNVLSGLVYEDQALAVKFIDQLSDLYTKALDGKQKELIPLQDEMDFIRSYIFLLKTRFEDKLEIHLLFSAEDDEYIAPMVLQLLVENAVKHNKISKAEPLQVSITKDSGSLVVSNNLQPKKAGDLSRGTGLQNIRQRYSFFTERPIEVEKTSSKFTVKVPLLHAKTSAFSYHNPVGHETT